MPNRITAPRLILVRAQEGLTVRAVVVEVAARVHTVRHTDAWPAPESVCMHDQLMRNKNERTHARQFSMPNQCGGANSSIDDRRQCAGRTFAYTYRNRHRKTAMTWVRVVARDSIEVRTCWWQFGHCRLTGSGPTVEVEQSLR